MTHNTDYSFDPWAFVGVDRVHTLRKDPAGANTIRVMANVYKDAEIIELDTTIFGEVTRKVLCLQEATARQALMRLGWTPPDESPNYS